MLFIIDIGENNLHTVLKSSIQNDVTLTQSGLDIDDTGNKQSKETQPGTSPPHCGHCGLAVSKVGNSQTALDSPLY